MVGGRKNQRPGSESKSKSTSRPWHRGSDVKGGLNGQSGLRLDVEEMEAVLEQGAVVLSGCWLALVHSKFTRVG